jgi:ankyrin repeat protein
MQVYIAADCLILDSSCILGDIVVEKRSLFLKYFFDAFSNSPPLIANEAANNIQTTEMDTLFRESCCRDAESDTELHLVCGAGSAEDVNAILKTSDAADVNARGTFGFTPIFWAAHSGNLRAIEALLEVTQLLPFILDLEVLAANGRL